MNTEKIRPLLVSLSLTPFREKEYPLVRAFFITNLSGIDYISPDLLFTDVEVKGDRECRITMSYTKDREGLSIIECLFGPDSLKRIYEKGEISFEDSKNSLEKIIFFMKEKNYIQLINSLRDYRKTMNKKLEEKIRDLGLNKKEILGRFYFFHDLKYEESIIERENEKKELKIKNTLLKKILIGFSLTFCGIFYFLLTTNIEYNSKLKSLEKIKSRQEYEINYVKDNQQQELKRRKTIIKRPIKINRTRKKKDKKTKKLEKKEIGFSGVNLKRRMPKEKKEKIKKIIERMGH